MYIQYQHIEDVPVTFRLISSTGQTILASTGKVVDSGLISHTLYGGFNLPVPLTIAPGGNATIELLNGPPTHPEASCCCIASLLAPTRHVVHCQCEVAAANSAIQQVCSTTVTHQHTPPFCAVLDKHISKLVFHPFSLHFNLEIG
jgi:hypothetical protein